MMPPTIRSPELMPSLFTIKRTSANEKWLQEEEIIFSCSERILACRPSEVVAVRNRKFSAPELSLRKEFLCQTCLTAAGTDFNVPNLQVRTFHILDRLPGDQSR